MLEDLNFLYEKKVQKLLDLRRPHNYGPIVRERKRIILDALRAEHASFDAYELPGVDLTITVQL